MREPGDLVWNAGGLAAADRLVAPHYVVHTDPGDPSEGQTLGHATYHERVGYSRCAVPDLLFTIHDLFGTEQRACGRWTAEGRHAGDLAGLPATGKRLRFAAQANHEAAAGRVVGHWQVVDRLEFVHQLRDGRA